jgi:hypothetical protein
VLVLLMTMPSRAEVTAQMAAELGTGQDTYLPARQLAAWQKAGAIPTIPAAQDQTQLLRMYMALKTVMAGKGHPGRISASQFAVYVRTITHSTSFKRKLWVVPKANFEFLDRGSLSKYIIDKSTVEEFPDFANPMDIELVDQCIAQSILGIGVQDHELSSAGCGWGLCDIGFSGSYNKHNNNTLNTNRWLLLMHD